MPESIPPWCKHVPKAQKAAAQLLHAGPLVVVEGVAALVQRDRRGGVLQQPGEGYHVHLLLQRPGCEDVAQRMKIGVRDAGLPDTALEQALRKRRTNFVVQTVRLALDVDDGAVMQDAVQNCGRDGDVGKDLVPPGEGLVGGKDLVPPGEGLVGGKDGRRLLISPCNKLEEQICALDVHGEVADLVNDEHLVLGQDPELVRQTVLEMGFLKLLDELVAVDVVDRKAVPGGHKAQGGGQVGLVCTRRPEEYHVLPILQEAHGGQFVDLALV